MSTKINYETPVITDEMGKPKTLANQPYPYTDVASDRRFEELIYSIYKKKIEHDAIFTSEHDAIQLMQGVGESGRDCVMYKNGVINAAIQCKKYNDRISRPDCAKEIIKFLLFSIIEPPLLPDINRFTYYFVASGDFTEPAATLLDDFGKNIVAEKNLQEWTDAIIKKYTSFRGLVYNTIEAELKKKLSLLKVKRIAPCDLDIELNQPYASDLITLFFEVKTVFDARTVEALMETITQNKITLSDEQIVQKFETASLQLSTYKTELSNLPGSHIKRSETTEIIAWLKAPLRDNQKPVLLLEGDPGLGKSVILKDVYDELVKATIPVAGIKSDRYYVSSITELSERMNLDYSIIDLAKKLLEASEQVVFLIDQIDSLSQAVTAKRDYIDSYNKILHELQRLRGVRIVVSIRTFDLTYDYEFSHYRTFKKVTVHPLSREQVAPVLSKLGINTDTLSDNLLRLISIPNHLDIFCKIFSPGFNTDQITTVQDLYDELWNQKVSASSLVDAQAYSDTLFEISQKMYLNQTLVMGAAQLSDIAQANLPYLTSCGLIDRPANDVQFFHQSFRDYVFAKDFTQKKQSVRGYIESENQSLYIRPALKMILTSLRVKDPKTHIQTITDLLFSGSIRLHIQLLVLNQLSFEPHPNEYEKAFVVKRIAASDKYRDPFLEAAATGGWFTTLADAGVLDKLIITSSTRIEAFFGKVIVKKIAGKIKLTDYLSKFDYQKRMERDANTWYQILRRALADQPNAALNYLDKMGDFTNKSGIIVRLLTFVKKWNEPLACKLFDQHYTHSVNGWSELDHVIEEAISYQYKWCLDWFEKTCFDSASEGQYHDPTMIAYHKNAVLKRLFTANREETFVFGIRAIKSMIMRKTTDLNIDTTALYHDIVSALFNEDDKDHGEFHEMLYKHCMTTAKELASATSPVFDDFIKNAATENSLDIIKIMLYAFEGNPAAYHNEIFTLVKRLYHKHAFRNGPKFYLRKLITASFTALDPAQQQDLVEMIMALPSENEISKREIAGKIKFVGWYGYLQFEYLSSIPAAALKIFPSAYKKYLELARKFKTAENKRDFHFSSRVLGAPLERTAYEAMQLDQWENSFMKYDKEHDFHSDNFKGGLTQHYSAFEEQVSKRPEFFVAFIEKLIDEKKVRVEYMIAGVNGLIKANYDPQKVFALYKKLILVPMARFDVLRTMWMITYFTNNRIMDREVFDYACNVALHDTHPAEVLNPTHPEFDMLNTNRGAAADAVALCWFVPEFEDRIFKVLEKIGSDPIISVRLSAMRHMAFLMHRDKEKTLKLFLHYTGNTADPYLYKFSIAPAQYLARYNFKAMIPYFKTAVGIEEEEDHNLKGNIAILLAMAWMNDEEQAFEMLEALWTKSEKARSKMVEVAVHNYKSDEAETKRKSEWLFQKFLRDESKDVIHEYTSAFLHLSPADFLLYYPLIKEFSASQVAKKDPHYFYDYLIKCCKQHPVQCLDLLTHFRKYNAPDPFKGPYYEGTEPVKILVGSYNGLYETLPLNKKYVIKAMDQFDKMLQQPMFRNAAQQVLNSI